MGLLAQVAHNLVSPRVPPVAASSSILHGGGIGGGAQNFQQFARRGYMGNEIIFAAIELLATSAAEPHIIGRRWRRESPRFSGKDDGYIRESIRDETIRRRAIGYSFGEINRMLVRNGFVIQVPNHPLVRLVNAPNPFMSRGQFWSTIVMDRYLGGNPYALKARNQGLGNVQELWRLRPDRVRIIPDKETFCKYEYRVGSQQSITYDYNDVMHFKTRNPLDDYYGMPPMMAISGRMDIDAYMQGFLKTFFDSGGTGPGAILTSKNKLSETQREDIRKQAKHFNGPAGWFRWMIVDNTETTYQQLGLNRGIRDALPKEIDAQTEARISMAFGIPGSILGTLIGYESSSYANKRQDRETLWKIVMAPLLSDLDDVLNLSLVPEFGGIDELMFDLADIEALQEEVDKLVSRWLKILVAGGCSLEEFRDATGLDPENLDGTYYIPGNIIPTPGTMLLEAHPPMTADALRALMARPQIEGPKVVAEARCPNCGWLEARNVNIGAELHCRKCKETFVVE